MTHYIFTDKTGKEYEVLVNETTVHAYLYEDGFEIFKGTISDILKLGLKFFREVPMSSNTNLQ